MTAEPEVLAVRYGLWNAALQKPGMWHDTLEATERYLADSPDPDDWEVVPVHYLRPAPVPAAPADDEVRYGIRTPAGYVSIHLFATEADARQRIENFATDSTVVEIRPVPPPKPVFEVTVRFTSRKDAELYARTEDRWVNGSPAEVGPVVEVTE